MERLPGSLQEASTCLTPWSGHSHGGIRVVPQVWSCPVSRWCHSRSSLWSERPGYLVHRGQGKATSSACSNRTPIRWSLTFKSARATGRRGSTPKELSEKFGILHTVHPRAGPSALSSVYPPAHRKGRKSHIRYHLAPICLRLRPQFTASLGQKGGL